VTLSRISIVGGGIGGLSAALALQHYGFRVSVFEQARELREVGAGVIITPNAMHALNFLGVGERIAAEAGPGEAFATRHFQTGEVLKIRPAGTDYVEKFGATYHQVHRVDLHTALTSAVRRNDPDCVFLDHRFEALTQDPNNVVAAFTNGATYASDVLIGCDGNASKVRACLFGEETVSYTGQVAFRALVPMADVPARIRECPFAMFVGDKRYFLHYPLRNRTMMNLIGVGREPRWQEEGWRIPAAVEEFENLYGDLYPPALQLIRAISPGTLFKWGLRDREPLQRYSKGRVAMLGDAAHPMTPFLGQGACIAIEDAMVLGRAFAAAKSFEEAFLTYEMTRRERANGVQLASRRQADEIQGVTAKGANAGKDALERGLYSYNPVTVPLAAPADIRSGEAHGL
jgi:2-polyprenyl-6-methoxyphenol hydroxylase-like FAD-dependent oxidoreductase